MIENKEQRPKSIAGFCRVFCDYNGKSKGARLKLAAALRTETAGSQDELRGSAIHKFKFKVKGKSTGRIALLRRAGLRKLGYSIQPPVTLITWPVM
jgi:hypothetical protein